MTKMHLICNAHLDPVWLWEWEEGAAEAISTFRTAADLLDEFDSFIFNHNEAILYQWVEEYDPQLFSRIQKHVRQKRWHIMGGWYLQPDCNMPSGEGLLRQALSGRQYFSEKFGVEPTVAINFDPFGHSRGLVQILNSCGYKGYIFCRPGPEDLKLPNDIFLWKGFAQSEVIGIRPPGHYNSLMGEAKNKIKRLHDHWEKKHPGVVLWGVGNHGGGPSRIDLTDLKIFLKTNPDIIHSTPEKLLEDINKSSKQLPIHSNDLNPWAPGCYTSQILIKQQYRKLEDELFLTEKICSIANANGSSPYPFKDLEQAEQDLLMAQFHDILPGSAIPAVEKTSLRLIEHGREILSRVKARAFFSLATGPFKPSRTRIPILVFNPHPYSYEGLIECEFQLADQNWGEGWTIPTIYQNNKALPTNLEQEASHVPLDWRKKVVFHAKLKAGCMNYFEARLNKIDQKPVVKAKTTSKLWNFKTDEMELSIDPKNGLISKYRVDQKNILPKKSCQLIVIKDDSDPWGMNVSEYRTLEGEFKLANPKEAAILSGLEGKSLAPIRLIEDGPARSVVEATFVYKRSYAQVNYFIPKVGRLIEVEINVHWQEKDRMLKVSFPTLLKNTTYEGETAYGTQTLPLDGTECVSHRWAVLNALDHNSSFAWINRGIYGSDCKNNELRLSLLRSPAYSAHPIDNRPILPLDRNSQRIDQGFRTFNFAFLGGDTTPLKRDLPRLAQFWGETPIALSFYPSGKGQPPKPLIVLKGKSILLSSLKPKNKNGDWLFRLFNPQNKPIQENIDFPRYGLKHKIHLNSCEFKTLRLNSSKKKITETDSIGNSIKKA